LGNSTVDRYARSMLKYGNFPDSPSFGSNPE
jgi:hypothetical protein